MSPEEGDRRLVVRVLAGEDLELTLHAARGLLPLPPAELVPLQVTLARGDHPVVAEAARRALLALDGHLAGELLARGADAEVQAWFAAESPDPVLLEVLLRRRDVPREILVELAPRLPPGLQEVLVHRQDALVDEPRIADALERNPELTPYVRRRLGEYRQHLLRPAGEGPAWGEREQEEPTEEEVEAAIAEASRQPEGGESEPFTRLSEAQIRVLPVPVRLHLARGAPRTLRAVLLRDPNPLVARTVLLSNTFAEDEIERIAKNRNMDEEVLAEIYKRREWIGKYRVVLALVHNPRTPLAAAIQLVARLAVRDLRMLSLDRNVPEAVRSTAKRLYRIKRK